MSKISITRRGLLQGGAAGAALTLVGACSGKSGSTTPVETPKPTEPVAKKKKILILGGTGFLGPKTIDAAIARGHTVTIFNRGKREKFLPLEHQVEHLYGNRDPNLPADDEKGPDGQLLRPDGSPKGLEQLVGKQWDIVIDNSGYFPRMVKASAELLSKNASRYIFISSISAYAEPVPANMGDETAKLAELADPTVEEMGKEFQNYGGLKVLCERAVEAAFPGRTCIVRPGYIVGPGDPTDRFTYWPVRLSKGGDVLAPGAPEDPLQWIDVRDLAEWLVTLAENETVGAFHAVGPTPPAKWGDVLASCNAAANAGAKLEWVPVSFLESNEAGGEDAFPIWIPPKEKYAGFHRWNNKRAVDAGMKMRPMDDTAKAILEWWPKELERRTRVTKEMQEAAKAKGLPEKPMPDPTVLRAGPPAEREKELLAKWAKAKK